MAGWIDVNKRWIDVNERLPEKHEDVLCWYEYFRYGNYNRMYQTYGIGYCINGHWGGEVMNGTKCRVIAWQPLPKPPVPKLQSCPACGFVAIYDENLQDGVRVRCTYCENKTDFYNNKIEAAEDWNTHIPTESEK